MTIYLDHAATTKVYPEVIEALAHLLGQPMANPSSIHQMGVQARGLIDQARISTAQLLEVQIDQVIFTSGATESLCIAIRGLLEKNKETKVCIAISPLIHSAVNVALKPYKENVEQTFLPLTEEGHINLEVLDDSFWENTDLIITEYGASETGHLQPVARLGKLRDKHKAPTKILIDATAAAVTEHPGLAYTKSDFVALSGEKIGGVAGTGVLLIKDKSDIISLSASSHEFGMRAGTENIIGITAFKIALESKRNRLEAEKKHLETLHELARKEITKLGLELITPKTGYTPHILTFLLPEGFESKVVTQQLDLKGIAVSVGSACSSGTAEGMKVVGIISAAPNATDRALRISFGWNSTNTEIKKFIEVLMDLVR